MNIVNIIVVCSGVIILLCTLFLFSFFLWMRQKTSYLDQIKEQGRHIAINDKLIQSQRNLVGALKFAINKLKGGEPLSAEEEAVCTKDPNTCQVAFCGFSTCLSEQEVKVIPIMKMTYNQVCWLGRLEGLAHPKVKKEHTFWIIEDDSYVLIIHTSGKISLFKNGQVIKVEKEKEIREYLKSENIEWQDNSNSIGKSIDPELFDLSSNFPGIWPEDINHHSHPHKGDDDRYNNYHHQSNDQ